MPQNNTGDGFLSNAAFMGWSQQSAMKINHSLRTGGSPLSHSGTFFWCKVQTYAADSSQAGSGPWVLPSNPLPFLSWKSCLLPLSRALGHLLCLMEHCHCACTRLLELGAIMSTMAMQCVPSKKKRKLYHMQNKVPMKKSTNRGKFNHMAPKYQADQMLWQSYLGFGFQYYCSIEKRTSFQWSQFSTKVSTLPCKEYTFWKG